MNGPARVTADAESFARLYDATSPRIYGLVLRVVRDPALAEQVTRDVYLQAWVHAHGGSVDVVSWLLTSAHRQAVDRVRSAEVVPAPAAVAQSAFPEPAATPAALRAAAALDRLPDAERQAVELTWFGGYTHAEADLMLDGGDTKVLVRSGLHRCRSLLEPA